ncbi:MAG: phosphatase PAP2 family protein [Bacteroidales bacterium]|nr:phosphatase PAP2 family protein [Bacteroidales bacterium]
MNQTEKREPLRLISQVVSILFHPVFMPLYGLLIIFFAPTIFIYIPGNIKRVLFMLVLINMMVVPLAMLPLFRYRNIISSYSLTDAGERVMPLALGLLMYILTTIIFFSYQIPALIKSFILAASVVVFILLMVTLIWKISIHSAGMGGLLATVMALSVRMGAPLTVWLAALILLSGVVMASRLYLGAHKPGQVYWGFVAGFLPFMIILLFLG